MSIVVSRPEWDRIVRSRRRPFPNAGVEKDGLYFAFWYRVAIGAAIWGLSVLGLLGGIWVTLATHP